MLNLRKRKIALNIVIMTYVGMKHLIVKYTLADRIFISET